MKRNLNIIHLPHRADRLGLLTSEMAAQAMKACIRPGILSPEGRKKGISRAHKHIVSWARQQQLSLIMIAEDDIRFTAPGAFDHFI